MTGGRAALRLVLLLAAALAAVTLGARHAGPLPDLVVLVVVAGALLSGATSGAVLGLAAGWVVDLMPPGSQVLGTDAVLYAVAGAVAGSARREGRAPLGWIALACLASAGVVQGGRALLALAVNAPVGWSTMVQRLLATVVLGVLLVPLLVRLAHALVRRRLA